MLNYLIPVKIPILGELLFLMLAPVMGVLAPTFAGPCTYSADCEIIRRNAVESVFMERMDTICEGEFFVFRGVVYNRDTMVCETLPGSMGLDSTTCLTLTVIPQIVTVDTLTACEGEILEIGSEVVKTDAEVCIPLRRANGCDSTHCVMVRFLPSVTTFLNPVICKGESFSAGSNSYRNPGQYVDRLIAENGCDSIVITQLRWHESEPPEIQGRDVLCSENDFVELTVEDTYVDYRWLPGSTSSTRYVVAEPGQYLVIVTTGQGCLDTASIDIGTTDLGLVAEITSDYDGWPNSCPGRLDAEVQAFVSGGTGPYQFLWNNGRTGPTLDDIGPGLYTAVVTDSKGCTIADTVSVFDRLPIEGMTEIQNPICQGENTGSITVSVINANPPFEIFLNDAKELDERITNLAAGDYEIVISDRFGCSWYETATVIDPPLLTISLPSNEIVAQQGDSLRLEARSSIQQLSKIEWTPAEALSCTDCLQPVTTTTKSKRYTVRVTDSLGCTRSAAVLIKVDKQLRLFLPSAFSPDGDQQNDFFHPITSSQVLGIPRFEVFDRWGNRLYHRTDLQVPTVPEDGWDGKHLGQNVPTGVYVYWVQATLVDGRNEVVKGEVLLLR